jgi:hypothetical protein
MKTWIDHVMANARDQSEAWRDGEPEAAMDNAGDNAEILYRVLRDCDSDEAQFEIAEGDD